jgi:hypothetical protein
MAGIGHKPRQRWDLRDRATDMWLDHADSSSTIRSGITFPGAVERLTDAPPRPSLVRVPVQLHDQAAPIAVPELLCDYMRFELEHVERVPAEVMTSCKIQGHLGQTSGAAHSVPVMRAAGRRVVTAAIGAEDERALDAIARQIQE